MTRILTLALALLALVQAGDLAAQTPKVTQTVRVYDATLSYPPPMWVKSPTDALEGSTVHREQKGNFFLMEQIRKTETLATWKEMLKITALQTPEAQRIGIARVIDVSNDGYHKACGDNFGQHIFRQDAVGAVFGVFCGNTPRGPAAVGYGDGVGEISVNRIFIARNTIVLIQYAWRRGKFDQRNQTTYPVPQATILQAVGLLESASATVN
jgi:hypothetical protein